MSRQRITRKHSSPKKTPITSKSQTTIAPQALEDIDLKRMKPDAILQLQRIHGNHFVNQLLQRNEEEQPPMIISKWVNAPEETKNNDNENIEKNNDDKEPEFEGASKVPEIYMNVNQARRIHQTSKDDNRIKQIKENNTPGFKSGVETTNKVVGSSVKMATTSLELAHIVQTGQSVKQNSGDGDGNKLMSVVNVLKNSKVLSIFSKYLLPGEDLIEGITKSIFKYKEMNAYKKLAKEGNKDGSDSNASIGQYAYKKTLRGFISRVANVVLSFAQLVSRLITMLTGGTTALVTEAIDLAAGLAKAGMKLGRMGWGLIKIMMGKRGKNRAKNANMIVDRAFLGDKEMCETILSANVFGPRWYSKMQIALGKKGNHDLLQSRNDIMQMFHPYPKQEDRDKFLEMPKTQEELIAYLKLMNRYGAMKTVKKHVAETMKSQ